MILKPISTWEVLLLHSKRKIEFQIEASEWTARATQDFREAPLTHEIVVVSRQLSLPHADPADRFLAATAKVHGLTLVTRNVADIAVAGVSLIDPFAVA